MLLKNTQRTAQALDGLRARARATNKAVQAQIVRIDSDMVDSQPLLGRATGHIDIGNGSLTADARRNRQPASAEHVGFVVMAEQSPPDPKFSIAPNGPYIEQNMAGQGSVALALSILPGALDYVADSGKLRHAIDWLGQFKSIDGFGVWGMRPIAKGLADSLFWTPQEGLPPRRLEGEDWSVRPGSNNHEVLVDIRTLPLGDGRALTAIEWTSDGGQTLRVLNSTQVRPHFGFSPSGGPSLREPSSSTNLFERRRMRDLGFGLVAAVPQYDGRAGGTLSTMEIAAPAASYLLTDSEPSDRQVVPWETNARVAGGRFVIDGMPTNTPINIKVRAVNGTGPGPWSEPKSVWAQSPNAGKISARHLGLRSANNSLNFNLGEISPGELVVILAATRRGAQVRELSGWVRVRSLTGVESPIAIFAREVQNRENVSVTISTTGGGFEKIAGSAWVFRHRDGKALGIESSAVGAQTTTRPVLPPISHSGSSAILGAFVVRDQLSDIALINPGRPELPMAWSDGRGSGVPVQIDDGDSSGPLLAPLLVASGGAPGLSHRWPASTANVNVSVMVVSITEKD